MGLYAELFLVQLEFCNQRTTFLIENHCKTIYKQESPPAWTQEAHRPPRSKYTLCCSGRGVPLPERVPPPGKIGTPPPIQTWEEVPPHPEGRYPPPHPDPGPPRHLDGVPPPHRCEQTDTCENSTFPRTTYAGGNQSELHILPAGC